MLGERGCPWPLYLDRMPRAEAKLLAMDDVKLRGGRCCWVRDGTFAPPDAAVPATEASSFPPFRGPSLSVLVPDSSFESDGGVTFSSVAPPSACSGGSSRSSARRRWCSSSSRRVRRASRLEVCLAALANSPAARTCSLTATVVLEAWVAREARAA
jgi:hypothetical protein